MEHPQFSLVLSASISPTCTNKSICWKIIDDDATLGLQGSLSRVICGLPDYTRSMSLTVDSCNIICYY